MFFKSNFISELLKNKAQKLQNHYAIVTIMGF